MSLWELFDTADYRSGTTDLLLCAALTCRFADERPFVGVRVVVGHPLLYNSLAISEAIMRGGGEVVLTKNFTSTASATIEHRLRALDVPVLDLAEAAAAGDLFIDVNAALGRTRTPRIATEITRTGVLHYAQIPCPTLSADDTRAKLIEGSLGIGDSFVRAWEHFQGVGTLRGKSIVQFGFGKIGQGIALAAQRAGCEVSVVDSSPAAVQAAKQRGYEAAQISDRSAVRALLADAEVVVAVTGVANAVGASVPAEWLRANSPLLINMGAEDEFGPMISDHEVLGGKGLPLNFHLSQPTLNCYIDPSLAAQLLALELLVKHSSAMLPGVFPLPAYADHWLVETWQRHWPNEDTSAFESYRQPLREDC